MLYFSFSGLSILLTVWYEPPHDKTNKVAVRPAKTQISLGKRPVWSESSLSAWRKLGSLPTHWVHSEDSDQTGRMPRLIWVFAGRTLTLLVLTYRGSFIYYLLLLMQNLIWATTWQNQQCGCAPSEDSDQPGHPPSVIRVFAMRLMGS